jgi:hypothetical protein
MHFFTIKFGGYLPAATVPVNKEGWFFKKPPFIRRYGWTIQDPPVARQNYVVNKKYHNVAFFPLWQSLRYLPRTNRAVAEMVVLKNRA